jgi:DNA-binding NtrC family response regulator
MNSSDNHYQPAVLIVDDEEMVTTSLRNLFKLRTDYRTLVYSSPEQALAEAPQNPVDVAISDYLMPGLDGITFLTRFKAIQPQAVRILLTGYADKENAIKAINTVGLYQYIEKPWDNDNLLMIVQNGVDKRSLLRTLEEKIAELDETHSNLKSIQTELIKAFM